MGDLKHLGHVRCLNKREINGEMRESLWHFAGTLVQESPVNAFVALPLAG